jgi:hypothetical protein
MWPNLSVKVNRVDCRIVISWTGHGKNVINLIIAASKAEQFQKRPVLNKRSSGQKGDVSYWTRKVCGVQSSSEPILIIVFQL